MQNDLDNPTTRNCYQIFPLVKSCKTHQWFNPLTRDNCYIGTNYNRSRLYAPTHNASIGCGYLIANHNHSCLIKNTNMWSFQWADHELIWWTKWHGYFFIMSVINKHQNDQWLQCHSVSCTLLLNISLNTEVYLYDLKMGDTDYRYVTDSIFWHSRLSDILSCDKPCRINGFWLYLENVLVIPVKLR